MTRGLPESMTGGEANATSAWPLVVPVTWAASNASHRYRRIVISNAADGPSSSNSSNESARRNMRLIESNTGTQILPPVTDERATNSAWHAYCTLDADQRMKHPEYRELAEGLTITRD